MRIIFTTGYGDVPMTIQALKAAVEFLTKPFDEKVPLTAIGHTIERSSVLEVRNADSGALIAGITMDL